MATGTLTLGQLAFREAVDAAGISSSRVLRLGLVSTANATQAAGAPVVRRPSTRHCVQDRNPDPSTSRRSGMPEAFRSITIADSSPRSVMPATPAETSLACSAGSRLLRTVPKRRPC